MTTNDVDEYLATLPDDVRTVLEKIRKTIKAAAPEAVESFSYMMPAFKYRGRPLAYFAGFANHCSLFPASSAVMETYKPELKGYQMSKGTIRFTVSKPLPAVLVRKLVKARMAEIEAAALPRTGKKQAGQQGDLPKLGQPAQRALAAAGIQGLKQLTQFSEAEIKELHGIGPNALKQLHTALKAKGLSFKRK